MPSRSELVAFNRTTELIATAIGADLVIFQTLQDLIDSVRQFNSSIKNFDCSVFTGEYVTGGVDEQYLCTIEKIRADNTRVRVNGHVGKKEGKEAENVFVQASSPMNGTDDTVGLHNTWNIN